MNVMKKAVKKVVKKKIVKKKAISKEPVLSPDEFQSDRGINRVIPKVKSLMDTMRPNQKGLAVVFLIDNGEIKDGVFGLDVDNKEDGIGCIVHLIKLCGFNPVEVLNRYAKSL